MVEVCSSSLDRWHHCSIWLYSFPYCAAIYIYICIYIYIYISLFFVPQKVSIHHNCLHSSINPQMVQLSAEPWQDIRPHEETRNKVREGRNTKKLKYKKHSRG